MVPKTNQISFKLETIPILNKLSLNVDGEENNPTLELIAGHTYTLIAEQPLAKVCLVLSTSNLASNLLIDSNCIGNLSGRVVWKVTPDLPARLSYQVYDRPDVSGSIKILSGSDPILGNGVTDYQELDRTIDWLLSSQAYSPNNIAGFGLALDGRAGASLRIKDEGKQFLRSAAGDIYSSSTEFTIDDGRSVDDAIDLVDLQDYINYLGSSIAKIKGTTNYDATDYTSIDRLSGRISSLEYELSYLLSKVGGLR